MSYSNLLSALKTSQNANFKQIQNRETVFRARQL